MLFHSGSLSVVETTNFGIALNLSANSPSRCGHAPAKLSYVRRPMSSASACIVSSSLNWLPSSPRSNSNVHPGYLNGSPPGASITPSSDTNSVTTIRAGISLISLARGVQVCHCQDPARRANSSHDDDDALLRHDDGDPSTETEEQP